MAYINGGDWMKIIRLECKRMMGRMILLGFVAFVLVLSVYDSHRNLDRYDLYEEGGDMEG